MIDIQDVSKWYGSFAAVQNLNLRIPAGIVYGFLGENGAGKTTTIRMLLGLTWPDQGCIRINQQPVITGAANPHSRLGALLDDLRFYPQLSARQNLRMLARLSGPVSDQRIDEVLDQLGLQEHADKNASKLSHGQKQRLGIATALLPDNDIVVLDEPQNGLDPKWIRRLRELMRKWRQQGKTVLISSHRLNEIEQVCDQVGIIHRGQLLYQGAIDPLLETDQAITVGCDQPTQAETICRQHGWTVQILDDQKLRVTTPPEISPSELNRCLVNQGLAVNELVAYRMTLEDVFFRLTHHNSTPAPTNHNSTATRERQ